MFEATFWRNPCYRRELLDRIRSWKSQFVLLAMACASSGLVLLRWPTDPTIDAISEASSLVFRPLACMLTAAVMLLAPAFPATSLVAERKRGTLALLLNSPSTPLSIYMGKLLSNVTLSLMLIAVCLPALAASFAMGGISFWDHLGPLMIVLVVLAVQYSALGLWVSSQVRSSDASLRWTYACILALTIVSLGPLVLTGDVASSYAAGARWLTALSPISALFDLTGNEAMAGVIGIQVGWLEYTAVAIALTMAFSILTVRALDPILLDRARPTGKVTGIDRQRTAWRRMAYLVDPNNRKAGIPRWLNPILVKEFRTRKFGRLHWLIRLVAICAIVSLSLTVLAAIGVTGWGIDRIAGSLVLFQLALLLLVGPSLGASLIASEVESGGWQVLRSTPISAWKLLSGKIMSVVWTMLLVLLATVPGYAVMSFIQPAMSGQVGNVLISLLVTVGIVVALSACVSAFTRTTAAATATAYGLLLILFVGTFLVWAAEGQPFGPLLVERVLTWNPVAAALTEMKMPGFETYELAPLAWWVGLGISAVCLLVLAARVWSLTKPD